MSDFPMTRADAAEWLERQCEDIDCRHCDATRVAVSTLRARWYDPALVDALLAVLAKEADDGEGFSCAIYNAMADVENSKQP